MSVGVYGTNRASDVSIQDIDIFYNYTNGRAYENLTMFRLDPNDVLKTINLPDDEDDGINENLLEGLYNLKLPASTFNEVGIYTIYIKPKSFKCEIQECGVLSSQQNMRGIVINASDLPDGMNYNNSLQGYRVEYYNYNGGEKMRNVVRFIVSSNKVVPVTDNNGSTSQKTVKYRFDDSGDLVFLQLTPSSASNVKPNQIPFMGVGSQTIQISNTFFEPLCIEVEMVESDIDTVIDVVAGEQIKDVDNGIITHFDKNRNIIKQFDLYKIEDRENGMPLKEVKQRRDSIDTSQSVQDIVNMLE